MELDPTTQDDFHADAFSYEHVRHASSPMQGHVSLQSSPMISISADVGFDDDDDIQAVISSPPVNFPLSPPLPSLDETSLTANSRGYTSSNGPHLPFNVFWHHLNEMNEVCWDRFVRYFLDSGNFSMGSSVDISAHSNNFFQSSSSPGLFEWATSILPQDTGYGFIITQHEGSITWALFHTPIFP